MTEEVKVAQVIPSLEEALCNLRTAALRLGYTATVTLETVPPEESEPLRASASLREEKEGE